MKKFLALPVFAALLAVPAWADLSVSKLRCEYLVDPVGIDEVEPRLSWVVASTERGERQTAWQIIVASTPEALAAGQGDLWDSGKVAGDATSQIEYAGSALASRAECHWKVRAWDKDDQPSAWSAPAKWTIGLLGNAEWSAKWIDGLTFGTAETGTPATITTASYEAVNGSGTAINVTALLNGMVSQGSFALGVTNETFGGDPSYNNVKQLRIVYQRGGQTTTRTFPENAVVSYPADLPAIIFPTITSARYESIANPGTYRDVTSTLQTAAQGGSFSRVVNNTNFGPDPAYNQAKRLRVNYSVDGVSSVRFVAENATFNYPGDLPKPLAVTLTAANFTAIDGTASANVLANLNNRAASGPFSMVVNIANLGGDPAPNKVKRLRLEYTLDGKSMIKYVDEQVTLNYPADLAQPTTVPLLRKPFTLEKPVKKATLYAAALGIYELSLNGGRVGDSTLAPEWTDYTKRLRYQAYDVTSQLAAGENVFGAQLAPGWYSGHIGNGGFKYWGASPALLAQMEVTFTDGTTQRVVTDGSWKMAASPTTYTDFMFGEDYDARREVPGWNAAGFNDSAWSNVLLRLEPERPMSSQAMEPVRTLMEITPKTLKQPAPGKWTYDMGQNMVGVLRLKITAAAGTKITLRHGEMLNPDGTLYTANLRGAPSIDTYICKGGGEETWTPKFTFHGFQYVELTGVSTQPPLDAITGVVFSSDTDFHGEFTSSDGYINQLQSNIVWGQRGNYLSVPTDCPQRDERLGWLGDAQVFVRTATYNADIAAFYTKWMTDVTDSQLADGRLPDVAPDAAPSSGTPAWNDAVVICPWVIYEAYGDKRILEKTYPAMKKWVEYCRTNSTNGIRDRGRGADYGDWLSINADTNKELIGTAYYAYSARLLGKSAAVIGNTADAATYEALFQTIKTAFINKYVNQSTGAFIGTGSNTQCAYAMALKFDLLPTALRASVASRLEADVIAKGNHLSTGFVGVSYLLPVLTESGKNSTAYNLLMQDTFPSWLFSVKLGATTIWERWDGWTPERGFQSTIMNSFNHYSLGSCGEWLYGTVAGIDLHPSAPAYKKILIRPRPGGALTHASGKIESMHGEIASGWSMHAGGFVMNVTIPTNTTAEVHVPAADAAAVTESGVAAGSAEGVTFLRMEGGAAVYEVVSGRYRFATGTEAPGTDTSARDPQAPLKMRIATLMSNDGSGLEFVSVDGLSVNGATLEVIDGWIHYTPQPGNVGADSFTYTVRDSSGGTRSFTVNVGIIPADAPVQEAERIETLADGSQRIVFSGVPGRIYRIQSSDTLDGPASWVDRKTEQAGEDGSFELLDSAPLPGKRFYRAVFP
ncbi:family 78 glycoside hydrolase catalytic domain [Luteolibacter flavescens]|uniref:alpha-L-rhamnosidase n=1 Tax=Luteolibacter flavescens TaxID=1859460 RepID=A0ABT3FMA0_9BACT|nr:family 78 glycoside hydrolase catalytic domain [Luteolibacter flavescens]MCW1884696.1 family 78 glycoside hydrolase catalytic domain [Luteolibacter flavescens]